MSNDYSRNSLARQRSLAALASEFVAKYRRRITQGLAVYGEFVPETDTRCLAHEAIEECLDIGSYLEMLEEKHPSLSSGVQKIRAKAILLYGELKKLEEMELAKRERTQGKEGTD